MSPRARLPAAAAPRLKYTGARSRGRHDVLEYYWQTLLTQLADAHWTARVHALFVGRRQVMVARPAAPGCAPAPAPQRRHRRRSRRPYWHGAPLGLPAPKSGWSSRTRVARQSRCSTHHRRRPSCSRLRRRHPQTSLHHLPHRALPCWCPRRQRPHCGRSRPARSLPCLPPPARRRRRPRRSRPSLGCW